ncbi:unnamed protein product, partial [Gulo gulo]
STEILAILSSSRSCFRCLVEISPLCGASGIVSNAICATQGFCKNLELLQHEALRWWLLS